MEHLDEKEMLLLAALSEAGGAASLIEVAVRAELDPESAGLLSERLIKHGLVERVQFRSRDVFSITPAGKERLYYG